MTGEAEWGLGSVGLARPLPAAKSVAEVIRRVGLGIASGGRTGEERCETLLGAEGFFREAEKRGGRDVLTANAVGNREKGEDAFTGPSKPQSRRSPIPVRGYRREEGRQLSVPLNADSLPLLAVVPSKGPHQRGNQLAPIPGENNALRRIGVEVRILVKTSHSF